MILADVTVGLDTIAGGGVTGMLVAVMYAFLRRTKDTDERRDEATTMLVSAADDREKRAWAERDRAIAERDAARAEAERLHALLEEELVRRRTKENDLRELQRRLGDKGAT